MENKKKYYEELTLMKGIGIVLVILGHSFSFTGFDLIEVNKINKYIHETIYSFHMPMFFLIAGFLTNKYKDNLNKEFYISKIKRLLIPYIFINIIDAIPRHLFSNLVNNKSNSIERIVFYSGVATWFVYTLFILFLIFPIIEKYLLKKDRFYIFGIILFLLNLFNIGNNVKFLTVDRLVYMSFYFYVGYLFKRYYEKKYNLLTKNTGIWIVIFLFLFLGSKYDKFTITKIIFPFLGIISCWYSTVKLKNKAKGIIYMFLEFCGDNSLSFYLLEMFFATVYRVTLVKIIPLDHNFLLISSFFILKLFTLVFFVKYIISKNKILAFLLGAKYEK